MSENTGTRRSNLSPAKQALLEKLRRGELAAAAKTTGIPRRSTQGPAPLSFAQQRLWLVQQWNPESTVYNVSGALRLVGHLKAEALEQGIGEILKRHEVLRTIFPIVDEQPVQLVIPPQSQGLLQTIDLSGMDEKQRSAEMLRLAAEDARRPFNLTKGPLFHATLLRLSEQEHIFMLSKHHIIWDGWSNEVFVRELTTLYKAFLEKQPSRLPELAIQYADYAVWQREWLQGEVLEEKLSYWKRQLKDIPHAMEMPTDHARPPVQTFHGERQTLPLSESVSEALKALSQQEGATMFMTMLAAFKALIYRYTGRGDVIVGAPIVGRHRSELEGLIGVFINMLALRTDLSDNPTFIELLKRVRNTTLEAYAHQDLPFEKLVEELQPPRDRSRNPIFQVAFQMQTPIIKSLDLAGLNLSPVKVKSEKARFDLSLFIAETKQGLIASFVYNVDLFEDVTITRMLGHLESLLGSIVANPHSRINSLKMLSDQEGSLLETPIEIDELAQDFSF